MAGSNRYLIELEKRLRVPFDLGELQKDGNPNRLLCFAILMRAVYDCFLEYPGSKNPGGKTHRCAVAQYKRQVKSAKEYLASDMPHVQLCGVDPEWILRMLAKYQFWDQVGRSEHKPIPSGFLADSALMSGRD